MENCHVEIHDPFKTNHKDCDPKPTTDSEGMEDSPEFRLLMAYAQRRRGTKSLVYGRWMELVGQMGVPPNVSPQEDVKEEKKRKRKGWRRLKKLVTCLTPQTQTEPAPRGNTRCRSMGDSGSVSEGDEWLEEAASRLTEIADEISFVPPEIEADSADDKDVEKVISLLLREVGDQVSKTQEEELKKAMSNIFWNYDFFSRLITTLLTRLGLPPPTPENPESQTSDREQIAVTCEITSRLSAADTLPANRLLGLGARYLQEHHSAWARQQGGYGEAFYSEDEEDIQ